jgi:hypothetical protein
VNPTPENERRTGDLDVRGGDEELSRRLAAFNRTGDPSTLWPGLSEHDRIVALGEIERVTRAVLASARDVRLDPANAHTPYALHIAGHTSGVGPLLGRWIADGVVEAGTAASHGFSEQLAHSRLRTTRISHEVGPALDAIAVHATTPVVLRGFHTSRVYFDEPGVRRMADVDVLVPPELIAQAEAGLHAAGFRPASRHVRLHKRDWIGPTASRAIYSFEHDDERSPWNLELHCSLDRVFHPGAVAHLDRESTCLETMQIDGRTLPVLRSPLLVLALACHCSQELDSSRLLRVLEIVRVIRADRASGRLDWDECIAALRRTDAARYCYPALALAEDLAPGTVDERVLALGRQASTWAARHTVARLVPAGGSPDRRGALRQMMWTRGPVAVVHRLVRNFWPAPVLRPGEFASGWRRRLRRIRAGSLSLGAPDERRAGSTHDRPPEMRAT